MHRHTLQSVTTKPGDTPSDPRRRVQSESTAPHPSPVSEPLGERTGVPPRAALPCRNVALVRPPQASALLEAGETGSQNEPRINTIRVSSSGTDDLTRSNNIFHRGDDFIFVDSGGTGAFLVLRWHLHLCLEYSKQIRAVVFASQMDPAPIGYIIIARTYNAEPNVNSCFPEFDDEGKWLVRMKPEPSPYTFFGNAPPLSPSAAMEAQRAAELTAIGDSVLDHQRHIAKRIERMARRQGQGHTLSEFGSRVRGDEAIRERGGIRRQGRRGGPACGGIEEDTGPEAGPSAGPWAK